MAETDFNFNTRTSSRELNKFIADHLQLTMATKSEMKKAVANVCQLLHRHMRPRRIVEGGSLGKGTAVKNMSDIDLVLVLDDVRDARDLKEKLPHIKDKIRRILRSDEGRHLNIVGISETSFGVKFSVQGSYGNIVVDLLPTFHFPDLHSLYLRMKGDKEHWDYYSAALVQQQVEFVQSMPANVKNLIRFIKYWRKKNVHGVGRLPTSYVLELITIHVWEHAGYFDTLALFREVLEKLKDYRSLNVIWNRNYRNDMIPTRIKNERTLVLDPANPTNNVFATFDWYEVQNEAEKVLDMYHNGLNYFI